MFIAGNPGWKRLFLAVYRKQTGCATSSAYAISTTPAGNVGNVTVEIDGANFTTSATASLTLADTTIDKGK